MDLTTEPNGKDPVELDGRTAIERAIAANYDRLSPGQRRVIDMLLDQLKDRGLGPSVDWGRVDAFRPFGGIRIEDDVACTDDAPLNLTREAFAA